MQEVHTLVDGLVAKVGSRSLDLLRGPFCSGSEERKGEQWSLEAALKLVSKVNLVLPAPRSHSSFVQGDDASECGGVGVFEAPVKRFFAGLDKDNRTDGKPHPVMLLMDETDIDPKLETDANGGFAGDCDYGSAWLPRDGPSFAARLRVLEKHRGLVSAVLRQASDGSEITASDATSALLVYAADNIDSWVLELEEKKAALAAQVDKKVTAYRRTLALTASNHVERIKKQQNCAIRKHEAQIGSLVSALVATRRLEEMLAQDQCQRAVARSRAATAAATAPATALYPAVAKAVRIGWRVDLPELGVFAETFADVSERLFECNRDVASKVAVFMIAGVELGQPPVPVAKFYGNSFPIERVRLVLKILDLIVSRHNGVIMGYSADGAGHGLLHLGPLLEPNRQLAVSAQALHMRAHDLVLANCGKAGKRLEHRQAAYAWLVNYALCVPPHLGGVSEAGALLVDKHNKAFSTASHAAREGEGEGEGERCSATPAVQLESSACSAWALCRLAALRWALGLTSKQRKAEGVSLTLVRAVIKRIVLEFLLVHERVVNARDFTESFFLAQERPDGTPFFVFADANHKYKRLLKPIQDGKVPDCPLGLLLAVAAHKDSKCGDLQEHLKGHGDQQSVAGARGVTSDRFLDDLAKLGPGLVTPAHIEACAAAGVTDADGVVELAFDLLLCLQNFVAALTDKHWTQETRTEKLNGVLEWAVSLLRRHVFEFSATSTSAAPMTIGGFTRYALEAVVCNIEMRLALLAFLRKEYPKLRLDERCFATDWLESLFSVLKSVISKHASQKQIASRWVRIMRYYFAAMEPPEESGVHLPLQGKRQLYTGDRVSDSTKQRALWNDGTNDGRPAGRWEKTVKSVRRVVNIREFHNRGTKSFAPKTRAGGRKTAAAAADAAADADADAGGRDPSPAAAVVLPPRVPLQLQQQGEECGHALEGEDDGRSSESDGQEASELPCDFEVTRTDEARSEMTQLQAQAFATTVASASDSGRQGLFSLRIFGPTFLGADGQKKPRLLAPVALAEKQRAKQEKLKKRKSQSKQEGNGGPKKKKKKERKRQRQEDGSADAGWQAERVVVTTRSGRRASKPSKYR